MNDKKNDKKDDDTLNPAPPTEIPVGLTEAQDDGREDGGDDLTEIFEKDTAEEEAAPVPRMKKPRKGKVRRKRTKSRTATTTSPRPKEKDQKSLFEFEMKNEDLKELFQTGSVLIAIGTKSANWLMPDEIAAKMSSAYVKALTIFAPKITPEILSMINITAVTLQYIYGAMFGMFLTEKSKFSFGGKKDAGQMVSDKLNKINQWFSRKKNADET